MDLYENSAMKRFEGKVIIVTGAASASARPPRGASCLKAHLALVTATKLPLAEVAKRRGRRGSPWPIPPTYQKGSPYAMVATVVKRLGRLDARVMTPSVFEGGDLVPLTNAQWRKVMATDLDGVFFGCRALPDLRRREA